jgi:hypothetical protein
MLFTSSKVFPWMQIWTWQPWENLPYQYPQRQKVDGWGRICLSGFDNWWACPISIAGSNVIKYALNAHHTSAKSRSTWSRIFAMNTSSTQFHNSSAVPNSHLLFTCGVSYLCESSTSISTTIFQRKTSAAAMSPNQQLANNTDIGLWKGHEWWWQEIDSINGCLFGLSIWIRILGNPVDHDSWEPHKEFDPDQVSLCVIKVTWLMTSVFGQLGSLQESLSTTMPSSM